MVLSQGIHVLVSHLLSTMDPINYFEDFRNVLNTMLDFQVYYGSSTTFCQDHLYLQPVSPWLDLI